MTDNGDATSRGEEQQCVKCSNTASHIRILKIIRQNILHLETIYVLTIRIPPILF